ncbi:chromodomain-helicase-DNA-binding protein 4 [Cordyceps fumosorosea ARSEF 2679]|uniref:Chromodomain-helicase-DNA-binding protein 4 n=1 Tax=Cordyceps fumosorosea (strain ARSEF 2679) TaxID=1081104 RepID=A0A162KGA2_CORFA|nr:chromodomain-helicase-DNA-binding protein 4 [Cordyceps fumosorosea ARSEF 2679]OAA50714.1 chromodomain-helicase-DNA-binding protein 4 [Cordyceps fumosorosea ARSEF 2679]
MSFCDVPASTSLLPEQAPPPFTTQSQPSEQQQQRQQRQQQQHQYGSGISTSINMNRRVWNVQQSVQSSPVDTASLSLRGSMHLDGVGGSSRQHTASSSCASVGSNPESLLPAGGPGLVNYTFERQASNAFSYYLSRGNGQYTRLIPADTLPPLKDVPRLEEEHDGMVILEPIEKLHLENARDCRQVVVSKQQPSPLPDNLQKQIDCIVATSPKSTRRVKIYCDKWIHEGVCAFTQQGCKFKHEMPQDEATQQSLGLFHGLPTWWKKHTEDQNRLQRRGAPNTPPPSSSSPGLSGTATMMTAQPGGNEALRVRSHPVTPPTTFEPQLQQQIIQPQIQRQQQMLQPQIQHQRHHMLQQLHQLQHSVPPREPSNAQASFMPGPTIWKAPGSQWMQNGIVPFVRGPRRAC